MLHDNVVQYTNGKEQVWNFDELFQYIIEFSNLPIIACTELIVLTNRTNTFNRLRYKHFHADKFHFCYFLFKFQLY